MSLLTSPREMQPLRRTQHAPLVLEVTEQLNDLSIQGELSASQEIVQAIPLSSRPYSSSTPRKWKYWLQLDPLEKLDPEVEDVLIDIAEDFFKSVTTFACSLAKHRKSDTLEAKDVLLHAERSCNIALPGFGGDRIKLYKKPIKKSMASEGNTELCCSGRSSAEKSDSKATCYRLYNQTVL